MDFFWIFMIIVLSVIEILSINLTTVWFVISALVSLVISFFSDNFFLQFSIFVILGIILLVTTRPLLKRFLKVEKTNTNFDRVIGMSGIVTSDISPITVGEVKVDGKRWSAIADEEIKCDQIVEILDIIGVKLKVRKVDK